MTAVNRAALAIAIAVVAAGLAVFLSRSGVPDRPPPEAVTVAMPVLSQAASEGAALFAANCADCHGPNGAGSGSGPPLIHRIYEPGHHADGAFFLAVFQGVRAHHWSFGDMPPVEGLDEADVAAIVAFVREVQRANGIE